MFIGLLIGIIVGAIADNLIGKRAIAAAKTELNAVKAELAKLRAKL